MRFLEDQQVTHLSYFLMSVTCILSKATSPTHALALGLAPRVGSAVLEPLCLVIWAWTHSTVLEPLLELFLSTHEVVKSNLKLHSPAWRTCRAIIKHDQI